MARPLRIELAGGLYHVTSRGDRRKDIFLDDGGRLACQAGDFVIWHHALPHGSSCNFANYPRVVQYISMFSHDYEIHSDWR